MGEPDARSSGRARWKRKGWRNVGELITVKSVDSVRIEVVGGARAFTIPASLIVDLDDALKVVRDEECSLIVYKISSRPDCWAAECAGKFWGEGATPLQAIANMKESK